MSEYDHVLEGRASPTWCCGMVEAGVADARHHAREPDPRDPRDQPRHTVHAQGAPGQRPASCRRSRCRPSTTRRRRSSSDARAGHSRSIERVLDMWERTLRARGRGQARARSTREVDWVIKHKLIERYAAKHDLALRHPRVALLDLAYHDVNRDRGLFYLLEQRGLVDARRHRRRRSSAPRHVPPQTTRAKLRGEFIRPRQGAQPRLHRRLGAPEAQRPGAAHGALQGPVRRHDDRVERLIASMRS